MPLHPDARAAIQFRIDHGAILTNELTPDQARAQSMRFNALAGPGEPVARVEDRTIPGPVGEIALRLYYPSDARPLPVLIYLHGGGWVQGNLETADAVCRNFCNLGQCLVVSTNYRHAPEAKFPAAVEDAYAASRWVGEHAAELGGDPHKLAISGTSAGGNLAAAVTLRARERGTPHFAFQVLMVPVTNYDFETNSYRENADGYVLTRKVMEWCWGNYLASPADGVNPLASPLRAHDMSGLPPAFVATAEYDPLRDEGAAYADRLRAAGVPVQYRCYQGMIHSYLGAQASSDAMDAMRARFGQGGDA
jgi:acetyl esterase